jgi:NTP pyrophosphatase (non-canonical NTP hydrolase)
MELKEIISRALEIRTKYEDLEKQKYGKEWNREEIALGFVGDVGDLMKLIVANEGKRDIENKEEKLKHELTDCLWSIIILADKYDIDLEQSFLKNMNELEKNIGKKSLL